MSRNSISAIFLLFTAVFAIYGPSCIPSEAWAQDKEKMDRAISLYQHENFEEALILLKDMREEDEGSSAVAYYLGLTYKKLQDFEEARANLEAAAKLRPPIDNAIPELIDVLYQCNETDEAKRWIDRAEKGSVAPAQVALLKGLVLLREKKDIDKAVASLDRAAELDGSLARTATYYKGIAYMETKKLADAKEMFRQIVIKDPATDMAAFANEYVEAITRKEDAERPFRGNVGTALQYDDNVILKPGDDSLASDIDNQGDWRNVYTCQGEYNFRPSDYFNVKGGGSFYYAKQFDLGFYDTLSADLSLYPAFFIDEIMVGFPVHYNYVRINDKHYLDLLGLSNVNNVMLGRDNMVQLAFQHNRKYYKWPVTYDNDSRDANEYLGSLGWFYFFTKKRDGFVQVRYALNYERAKGSNWTYCGNRFTVGATTPLSKKIRWSIVGDYFRQDFVKGNTIYEKHRSDDILTISNMVAIEVFKGLDIQLQHIFVDDAATIGIYKYKRNIYSAGVQYRF
ncbi:MAG: tetratricopeptide repeat protein [Candidatus Omnitrophota bacterium]